MTRIPIIIDGDPGHDDAIAMILALASDKLDVKGMTVVAGNQTLDKTVNNTLKILEYIKKDITVSAGADKPMRGELKIAASVHGESGLDGPVFPEPVKSIGKENAVQFMESTISISKEKITIVAMGPLTNIATFILCNPELKTRIKRICLMGGATTGGNWTPTAEFNIWQDPEAAHIVFNSGVPITMCGLDVTYKAMLFEEDVKKINEIKNKVSNLAIEILQFFGDACKKRGSKGIPLHDVVAVAWVINPTIFKSEKYNVVIDLDGEHTRGCTVTDCIDITKGIKNIDVVLDLDREKFIEMLISAIKTYN